MTTWENQHTNNPTLVCLLDKICTSSARMRSLLCLRLDAPVRACVPFVTRVAGGNLGGADWLALLSSEGQRSGGEWIVSFSGWSHACWLPGYALLCNKVFFSVSQWAAGSKNFERFLLEWVLGGRWACKCERMETHTRTKAKPYSWLIQIIGSNFETVSDRESEFIDVSAGLRENVSGICSWAEEVSCRISLFRSL